MLLSGLLDRRCVIIYLLTFQANYTKIRTENEHKFANGCARGAEVFAWRREMAKEDKLKALDAAIAQIEKQYGKGSVMKLGDSSAQMNVEAVPTGSLSLDLALGIGGLPKGRIIEIYGPESSGKTTVALHAVAEVQKQGGIAGFIDAEHAAASKRLRSRRRWCVPAPLTS